MEVSFIVLFFIMLKYKEGSSGTVMDLKILDQLLSEYDRRATPSNHLDEATIVSCELYIRSFGSIDPSSMDYQVDLYLRQTWEDPRLNHESITDPLDLNDPKLVMAIWKPEVYFPNAKHAEFQFVTVPNVLVRINPKGKILYMLRLKLTFSCMMELSKFPLDSQVCTMEVASFSKTMKELNLQWKSDEPIIMFRNLRMPQFEITDIIASDCKESFQIGNYSCLVAEFHMHRSIGFHLVQSYLPTILFVVISWVSFWMDVSYVPARTSLGVTTLLTVSSASSSIQGGLPQVSYVKAIDVWMGTCTAFVFLALMELTLVNYLWRLETSGLHGGRNLPEKCNGMGESDDDLPMDEISGKDKQAKGKEDNFQSHSQMLNRKRRQRNHKVLARRIDAWCRILFPFAFGVFNIVYWCHYLL